MDTAQSLEERPDGGQCVHAEEDRGDVTIDPLHVEDQSEFPGTLGDHEDR